MRILSIIFILLTTAIISVGDDLSKSVVKKMDKNISREFKGEDISRIPVVLSDNQKRDLKDRVNSIFRLKRGSDGVGFLVLTSAMGRNESFDYLVIYDTEFTVKSVDLILYNSNYGMEIGSRKWLKQYSGYSGGELNYGKDIQAISGATISAKSLTEDIKILTEKLKESGL
jgi:hypothetical protein